MINSKLIETYTEEFQYQEEGFEYVAEIEVNNYCIREGNYSKIASDPEEYYGQYEIEFDIISAYKYAVNEDDAEDMEITIHDLPKGMIYDIELKYEN